jgi:hypothetical protein
MADVETLKRALIKADQAGDVEAAKRLAAAIKAQQGGGAAAAPAAEQSLLDRVMSSMNESGKNVRESVMNPGQSIPDLLRSAGNFVSLGGTDRLRSMLYGTDVADEVARTNQASERLGSIDEAFNLGTALVQPSAAARYMPEGAGLVTKALGHGAEQAGLSGVNAAIEGRDVLPSMAWGAAGGAGGSVAADAVGSVANIFGKKTNPEFKTDEDLFAAAERAHKGTRQGKDLVSRADLVDQIRMAQTEGQKGFQDLNTRIKGYGRDAMNVPREVHEGISTLANKGRRGVEAVKNLATAAEGGSHWGGKLGFGLLTKGLGPVVGSTAKAVAGLSDEINPRQVQKIKDMLLKGAGKDTPGMTPEMRETLRNYLAKVGGGIGRGL